MALSSLYHSAAWEKQMRSTMQSVVAGNMKNWFKPFFRLIYSSFLVLPVASFVGCVFAESRWREVQT